MEQDNDKLDRVKQDHRSVHLMNKSDHKYNHSAEDCSCANTFTQEEQHQRTLNYSCRDPLWDPGQNYHAIQFIITQAGLDLIKI